MAEAFRHFAVPGSDEFACHDGEIAKAYLTVLLDATISEKRVDC